MKTKNKIDGVLLLDKSSGLSSNRALQQVKYFFNAQKAGHTGALDPLASGVLPICFGEATKFARFLLEADKVYEVTAKLGVIMDSGDATGNVVETRTVPELNRTIILNHIQKFIGATQQVPTMYSALKYQGQPLYKYARKNIEVEREARSIFVYSYELLSLEKDELTCRIACSKGTYIRTLIEDLGLAIGCGAHVTTLRRIKAGPFDINSAIDIDSLQSHTNSEDLLLPVESLLSGIPRINLSAIETKNFLHGKNIVNNAPIIGTVALFSDKNELLGIGDALNDGNITPIRLVATHFPVV